MNKPRWLIGVILLIIAAVAAFLFRALEPTPRGTEQAAANTVDYSMERVQATVFGNDGQPRYKLSTPRMEHFAQSHQTQVSDPDLRVVGQVPFQWRAHANQATLDDGGDTVILRGDVLAERSGQSPADYLSLKTDELTLRPKSRRAETDARVQLDSPVHSVTATGLRADLTERHVELLTDVHGTYFSAPR